VYLQGVRQGFSDGVKLGRAEWIRGFLNFVEF